MKKRVMVTAWVDIEIDEAKFTPEFEKEFSETISSGYDLDDHITNLAYREIMCGGLDDFEEGYGPIKDMGIKAERVDHETEIVT